MINTRIDVKKNLTDILQRIREYEVRYHRKPNSVSLVAACKQQSLEKVQQAIEAGQTEFAENYLQEALDKLTHFKDNRNITWHFIGQVQSNKIKKIVEHFDWVHTISDTETADRLNYYRRNDQPPLNICLQINVSGEASKAGIEPEAAFSLASHCIMLPRLQLRGLMTVPAHKNNLAEQRDELKKLRVIFDALNEKSFKLDTLSMGMSDDLEAAVAEGATIVRIGTAIFGARI